MTKYIIEIQSLAYAEVEAESPEEARIKVIDNLEEYNHDPDPYVSDAKEI